MIRPVDLQQVALLFGLRREQHRLDCLGPGQERTSVPPPRQVLLPRIGQTCRGVLANRLIEAEPGPLPARVRLQQRGGNQLTNQRTNLTVLDRLCPRHLLGRDQVKSSGEYAQPTEYNRSVSRQQRMTPGQARIQGVMPSPACSPGRPSRRPQPFREFRQRGNPQPDGHQFDRQGQPARLTADTARERQLSRSRLERHPRHRGPGKEQRHRLRHHRRADLAGNGHRRHPPHALGLDVKRDTARHQKPQTRGPPRQLAASTTHRFQHVLAVIDHQQRPAARHRTDNSIKSRRRLGPPDPHPLNQGGNHLIIGATWHQVDIARQLRPASRTASAGTG